MPRYLSVYILLSIKSIIEWNLRDLISEGKTTLSICLCYRIAFVLEKECRNRSSTTKPKCWPNKCKKAMKFPISTNHFYCPPCIVISKVHHHNVTLFVSDQNPFDEKNIHFVRLDNCYRLNFSIPEFRFRRKISSISFIPESIIIKSETEFRLCANASFYPTSKHTK